jgi:cobaltochelatase CobS
MGIPVWGVSCSGKTRFEHLVGSMSLVAGNTQFVDGPLLAAMRSGGIFLANEISRMDPGEQMRLVDVLDRRARLTIGDTGEVVEPHPDFRFAATGNSGGFGDSTGAYPGERVGSYAFADRFMKLHVKPMSEEMELRLLERVAPALSESYRKGMVKLATGVRSAFVGAGGCCRITITPRSLIDWAMLACEYRRMSGIDPLRESLLDIVVNGAPKDDQDVVMEVFDAWMKETGTA